MSTVRQCELRRDFEGNYRIMVTWLDADKNLKPGDRITLKEMPDIWWTVESIGQEHDRKDIKRGWGQTDFIGEVPKYINER